MNLITKTFLIVHGENRFHFYFDINIPNGIISIFGKTKNLYEKINFNKKRRVWITQKILISMKINYLGTILKTDKTKHFARNIKPIGTK